MPLTTAQVAAVNLLAQQGVSTLNRTQVEAAVSALEMLEIGTPTGVVAQELSEALVQTGVPGAHSVDTESVVSQWQNRTEAINTAQQQAIALQQAQAAYKKHPPQKKLSCEGFILIVFSEDFLFALCPGYFCACILRRSPAQKTKQANEARHTPINNGRLLLSPVCGAPGTAAAGAGTIGVAAEGIDTYRVPLACPPFANKTSTV